MAAQPLRPDYEVILEAVPPGARVLDVGCGNGDLMDLLRTHRTAVVRGMEVSQEGVNACVARGLSVVQGDADQDLSLYPDNAFDVVVLSQTIQAMKRPKVILQQMHRIGAIAVVSLPNFAHWRVRLSLLTQGRMPVTPELPTSWHETDNVHLCTLFDFQELAKETGWAVEALHPVSGNRRGGVQRHAGHTSNLLAETGVFILKRVSGHSG
jgi:methionine biosynthesis protein MetW